jgi:hypothetical protein
MAQIGTADRRDHTQVGTARGMEKKNATNLESKKDAYLVQI